MGRGGPPYHGISVPLRLGARILERGCRVVLSLRQGQTLRPSSVRGNGANLRRVQARASSAEPLSSV